MVCDHFAATVIYRSIKDTKLLVRSGITHLFFLFEIYLSFMSATFFHDF